MKDRTDLSKEMKSIEVYNNDKVDSIVNALVGYGYSVRTTVYEAPKTEIGVEAPKGCVFTLCRIYYWVDKLNK